MKLKFSQLAKAVLCTAAMAVSALGSMTISASAADNINVDICLLYTSDAADE